MIFFKLKNVAFIEIAIAHPEFHKFVVDLIMHLNYSVRIPRSAICYSSRRESYLHGFTLVLDSMANKKMFHVYCCSSSILSYLAILDSVLIFFLFVFFL
jgi:hypothetical protein